MPLDFAQQAAALSIAHLFVLAMGGYLLARGRELAPPLALMVALVAALNGWMMCWGASDWFGALAAFAWLPWSWWALERALRRGGGAGGMLLPGLFIYLLIAGGFPYTVLMLGLVTAWLGLRALARRDWFAPLRLGIGWLVGLGLSAPAWIALLDNAPGSRRALEVLPPRQWIVPFSAWPGFLLPSWKVPWSMFEQAVAPHAAIELACGLAAIVILIAALVTNGRAVLAKVRWELGLLAVVLALCMLPSAGMFRFSFRSLALFHVVLALAAAEAFRVWRIDSARKGGWGLANPGTWSLLLLALLWVTAAAFGVKLSGQGLALPLTFAIIALAWWLGASRGDWASWLPPVVTFVALLAGYLTVPAHAAVAHFSFGPNLNQAGPLDPARLYLSLYRHPPTHYLGGEPGRGSGAITRLGSTSMFAGVRLVNGYTPVGPAGITRLLDFGTHGHINPARVPEIVLPEAGPDGLLAQLGIDGILIAGDFELPAPLPANWRSVHTSPEGQVWHRDVALPPVRALADESHGEAEVRVIENSRQRVIAEVAPSDSARPVLVVYSRPFFPGYRARLNGKRLPVTSLQGLAPIVEIPAGQSGRLELVYRPRAVTAGGAIAALTVAASALALFRFRRG